MRFLMKARTAACVAALLVAGAAPAAAQVTAIRAGRLVDPETGTVAANQVILIEGGKFTATLLASRRDLRYGDDDADLTFIRVDVRGLRNGVRRRVCYDLVDTRDFTTGLTSMQRTVGFTLSLGARLILDGALATPGLLGPLDVPYRLVFPALERHGIHVVGEETAWA